MGIFNFFKKKRPAERGKATSKTVLAPTYLEGLTESVQAVDILPHEWRRKIKSLSGQKRFNIKYYGKHHPEFPDLIMRTDSAPILVYAVDPENGESILIFDGCKYGYDALFCEKYTPKQLTRQADKIYKSSNGDEIFEIVISIYNGVLFDNTFVEDADADGLLELADGTKQSIEFAERNAFDTLQVYAINDRGESFNFISEELS